MNITKLVPYTFYGQIAELAYDRLEKYVDFLNKHILAIKENKSQLIL